MILLSKEFDISQFDEYREDNRREVKRANGGLPVSLWDTSIMIFSMVLSVEITKAIIIVLDCR